MGAVATPATGTTRIHVGGLGQSVSSDDLWKVFSTVGTVEGVDIIRTKGRSFAYIDILPSSSNSLSKLYSTYNGCVWKGGKLKLEKAKDHYLTRLKREWVEAEAQAAAAIPQPMASSSENLSKNKISQTNHIRLFFPRLSKVKSLPLSGTGKHRYSFQRVQAPALPIYFCDCEEHSGRFNAVEQKEVQHQEETNGAMNEEELKIMSSVMNKLFERGNVSDGSRAILAKERDDLIKPFEDSLSNQEEEDDDDDDDLIINVVSNSSSRAAISGSREQRNISTEKPRLAETQISNGAIQSGRKELKKNTLNPNKKRKPLPSSEGKHEVVSVSAHQRRNSRFNGSEADLQDNEADENNLIINVLSIEEKGTALSGNPKLAKVSSEKKFKSREIKTSEDGSDHYEHEEEKDHLPPKKKMKSFSAEEGGGNEVISNVPSEKGNLQAQSNGFWVVANTTGEESLKQSRSSCSWSQKSSWRALVGDKSNSAFNLSNILQNVDTAKENELVSDVPDVPKVDNTPDGRNEKFATSTSLEDISGKAEVVNVPAAAQPHQPKTVSSNFGRGSSWLHKSSWLQLVSNNNNSFSVSEILPSTTTQVLPKRSCEGMVYSTDGNHSDRIELHESEPNIDGSTALGDRKEGDSVQSIPESNHQTFEGNKDASPSVVENKCKSEPKKGFGVDTRIGETCSFMRSSASVKEWAKLKAALKGSRKRKR